METKLAAEPAAAAEVGAVCQLVLEGDGGGNWLIRLRGGPNVTEGAGDADCTLRLSARDYVEMTEGLSDARQLFFSGRLRVEGDLSVAIKFGTLLEQLSR